MIKFLIYPCIFRDNLLYSISVAVCHVPCAGCKYPT